MPDSDGDSLFDDLTTSMVLNGGALNACGREQRPARLPVRFLLPSTLRAILIWPLITSLVRLYTDTMFSMTACPLPSLLIRTLHSPPHIPTRIEVVVK